MVREPATGDLVGLLVETPTWRANPDWLAELGDAGDVDRANLDAAQFLADLRDREASDLATFVVSGCIGPRRDGYTVGEVMSADEAQDYHAHQVGALADVTDLVSALTLTTAIEQVDAETGSAPTYFMINCAHPTHFESTLASGGAWNRRIRGLRSNASALSHAELDEAETLDDGDPADLGARSAALRAHLPELTVIGGCCGTAPRVRREHPRPRRSRPGLPGRARHWCGHARAGPSHPRAPR